MIRQPSIRFLQNISRRLQIESSLIATAWRFQLLVSFGEEALEWQENAINDLYADMLTGDEALQLATRKIWNPFKWIEFVYAVIQNVVRRVIQGGLAILNLPFVLLVTSTQFAYQFFQDKAQGPFIDKDSQRKAGYLVLLFSVLNWIAIGLLSVVQGVSLIVYAPILLVLTVAKRAVEAICSPNNSLHRYWGNLFNEEPKLLVLVLGLLGVGVGYLGVLFLPPLFFANCLLALGWPSVVTVMNLSNAYFASCFMAVCGMLVAPILTDFIWEFWEACRFTYDTVVYMDRHEGPLPDFLDDPMTIEDRIPRLASSMEAHLCQSNHFGCFQKNTIPRYGIWSAAFFSTPMEAAEADGLLEPILARIFSSY